MHRRLGVLLGLVMLSAVSCTLGGNPVISGPSARTTADSPSPHPPPPRWSGTIVTRSSHRLYVGGTCLSAWRTRLDMVIHGAEVRGRGVAERTSSGTPCPFATAQLQVRRFRLRVTGTFQEGRLTLRLRDAGHQPSAGADDLGGFRMTTLATQLDLRVRHGAVSSRLVLRVSDQDRGEYDSTNLVRLRCTSC